MLELFFSLSAAGRLTTRPMKGAASRGETAASDDAIRDSLQLSENKPCGKPDDR